VLFGWPQVLLTHLAVLVRLKEVFATPQYGGDSLNLPNHGHTTTKFDFGEFLLLGHREQNTSDNVTTGDRRRVTCSVVKGRAILRVGGRPLETSPRRIHDVRGLCYPGVYYFLPSVDDLELDANEPSTGRRTLRISGWIRGIDNLLKCDGVLFRLTVSKGVAGANTRFGCTGGSRDDEGNHGE
jgi:hypothetical protein